jgi:hypothetical protein
LFKEAIQGRTQDFFNPNHGHTLSLCHMMVFPVTSIVRGDCDTQFFRINCTEKVLGSSLKRGCFLVRRTDMGVEGQPWNVVEMPGAVVAML